ncbi:MAG: DivIVA domain-containing protein [Hamadaea sp.]|uniref:DivIVA domain-containing protein n=1 Tax=Hamadaea sp. TaxID=2024425 RepID=UPI0017AF6361|nr:DivIVA domain-containing protein [Hamadaea sp.]NUR69366.1 DivIVA domain-containing protein [Hamadaea sp.]NUT23183.1 DivIVA domain-containing protein [Hamadaea sp.]
MSQNEESYRGDGASRPSFTQVMRGYDKRQVDYYVEQVAGDLTRLSSERERAFDQVQRLNNQLQQARVELTELHQRPQQLERASFGHLGTMVDQIIGLAEKQAEAIVTAAAQRATDHQAEADKTVADARELADKIRSDAQAAREQADQDAQATHERSLEEAEQARTELQQEIEAVRAQTQQELAETRTAHEADLARLRNEAEQKNAALQAEAQQYASELRRKAGEQNAAHQQQLAAVQQEIEVRQQGLAQLQAALDNAQQRLGEARQQGSVAANELTELQRRLVEVKQGLSTELNRLNEARREADATERHAEEVRARLQREAKRMADRAAQAVMAAAAMSAETGEYQMVAMRPDGTTIPVDAPPAAESPAAGPVDLPTAESPVVAVAPEEHVRVPGGAEQRAMERPRVPEGNLFAERNGHAPVAPERNGRDRLLFDRDVFDGFTPAEPARRPAEPPVVEVVPESSNRPELPRRNDPARADELADLRESAAVIEGLVDEAEDLEETVDAELADDDLPADENAPERDELGRLIPAQRGVPSHVVAE